MRVALCILIFFLTMANVEAKNLLGLSDELRQGGFYVGKVAQGSTLFFKGKKVKISPSGYFAVGLDWKEQSMVKFRLVDSHKVTIIQRFIVKVQKYDVTHIDGLPKRMVTPPKNVQKRIAEDSARVKAARRIDSDLQDFREGFIWPVRGRISGNFGNHRILNGVSKSPHGGMDIAAPKGTAIVAPLGGVVTMVWDLYYTGNTVIIDHGFGVSTVFAHMDKVMVKQGQKIKKGDPIGTVGATGRATGPHLHWGLNWYRQRLNPSLVLGD